MRYSKVYKILNGYPFDLMNDVFHLQQNTLNLRNFYAFATDVLNKQLFVQLRRLQGKPTIGSLAF